MIDFLKLILSLSLSGTLLTLLLFLMRPLYRDRLSKRWQYYIWLIVIARLLLPVTPETSLMSSLFRQIEQIQLPDGIADRMPGQSSVKSDTIADFTSRLADSQSEVEANTSSDTDFIESKGRPENSPRSSGHSIPDGTEGILTEKAAGTILTVWLVIALLLFVRKVTVYQSFIKYLNAGSKSVDDLTLLERFGQIMEQLRIRGCLELHSNSLVSSPLLIGFIYPRIVLPDPNLPERDFHYTILHELIHYKRRDMFYKWLVQFTICLHWFNPVVYLMGREINCLCELSCDERVIKYLSQNERRFYGETLLNAISTVGSYQDALASITLNESKELLKGRLKAIMNYRKMTKTAKAITIFLTGILIGGGTVLGAYTSPSSDIPAQDIVPSKEYLSDITDPSPDYRIQFEDGIYYIFAGGATDTDKPVSGITNGYHQLILVRKDSYHTFGSWTDYEMLSLVKHITGLCQTSLSNGQITQEDMDIMIAAATQIEEIYRSRNDDSPIQRNYNYTQGAYYQHPYIIEIGYNLSASSWIDYDHATITLSDDRTLPVYFNMETEKFITNENAMSAVAALIERMLPLKADTYHPLETPLIISMEYVGDTAVNSLAEEYYGEKLTYFGAVFLELDIQTQQAYLDRMFEENNISFFACCIGMIKERDVQKDMVDHYILKAYQEDAVNFFAVLSGMLDEESRKQWMDKCWREYNTDYWYILSEDDEDYKDYEL